MASDCVFGVCEAAQYVSATECQAALSSLILCESGWMCRRTVRSTTRRPGTGSREWRRSICLTTVPVVQSTPNPDEWIGEGVSLANQEVEDSFKTDDMKSNRVQEVEDLLNDFYIFKSQKKILPCIPTDTRQPHPNTITGERARVPELFREALNQCSLVLSAQKWKPLHVAAPLAHFVRETT